MIAVSDELDVDLGRAFIEAANDRATDIIVLTGAGTAS